MPSALFAFESLSARLGSDLRTRFPAIEVRVWPSDGEMVCEVLDAGESWGQITLEVAEEDEFSLSDVEKFVARVVTNVVDNLWPDELVDPWPVCPEHRDHPLQPALVGGRASWRCLRNSNTVVPVGKLSNHPPAPPGWPFDDQPELGVFVTEEVFRQGRPVLWVAHDRDGDWLFGNVSDFDDDTTSLVHLSHVVAKHPEVAEVADLARGWSAERPSPEGDWVREPMDDPEDGQIR